ncbi:hypothetical protein FSP39_010939 [Pinctada imbricata]|uniref:COR domain-containing protein n=1 Tax=Pinctada imbricata TaxID=66713 RepID=A0AA89BQZ8_PINIB|nr:hypothetical protein FSP39_010939 [Pinctada imbricata]
MKKIPKEVKALGSQAASKFYNALQKDTAVSNVIRLMLVGHSGVGKTTIALNLLGKMTGKVDSTDGIEVYINQCFYNMESATWHTGDYLEYWISTIVTYATGEHGSFPRIILIGTHRDKVKDESDLQAIKESILTKFDQMVRSNQLVVRSDLFISSEPMTETTRSTIRNVILEQGMLYPEFGERVPRSWIALQEQLNKLKRKGYCIVTMTDLQHLNSELLSPLEEEEIDIFLRYLHSIGYILHFPSPSLRENIILDPKVVIDAMRSFITCKRFIQRTKTSEIYLRMRESGYVRKADILRMWKEKEVSQYGDHLLAVMKKLDLLCEPTIYQGGQKLPSDVFVVPSMITAVAPVVPVAGVSEDRQLKIVFSSDAILPPAIFHRLVCSCLALWTIYQGSFYQGLVVLNAGRQHIMEIKDGDNQICITFSHLDTTRSPDVQLCFAIKQFLSETMDRILDIYSTSYRRPITCKAQGLDALTDRLRVVSFINYNFK